MGAGPPLAEASARFSRHDAQITERQGEICERREAGRGTEGSLEEGDMVIGLERGVSPFLAEDVIYLTLQNLLSA